ncbi:MAG: NAD(P)(+) transhydrogenase (Re/Si-specific) subunit beta [Candidatus Marinimicrobia bacterium]|nr:NAD(P)(+) transhydrogenase (Re/Si-specific) subunit beta [Candidatus Neomarinimicrobiota bacterium]
MMYLEQFSYLLASVLFILSLKMLGSAKTARKGMQYAMFGMALAIVITLIISGIVGPTQIIIGMVVGGLIGGVVAKRIEMTSMPQMVALFNGFGGVASTLVAYSEYIRFTGTEAMDVNITVILSLFIGTVTLTGSLIAYAKLQGLLPGRPLVLPMHQILNLLLMLGAIGFGVMNVMEPSVQMWALLIIGVAAIFGVTFVIPIGGADMPVVIALLNSYSGLAASATGFVLSNNVLIIAGALVGASGLILTQLMCDAMNRSLFNVLFGAVGTDDSTGEAGAPGGGEQKTVMRYTAEDAAMIMDTVQSVIIVPGYGLAVAQAQHVLHEMDQLLTARGIDVKYAIHPVAGRMPGHMNVLLAEANVPYDVLYEMDDINDEFQNTDVALIIGANDVVNPSARTKKDSPLYGMPILNVDYARTVMFVKRSMGAGFAGEANPLFFDYKTMMVFGDSKAVITGLVKALKADE